jgi:hypothetical protein
MPLLEEAARAVGRALAGATTSAGKRWGFMVLRGQPQMSIQQIDATEIDEREISADGAIRSRLDFAERCFINVQDLSRFMDQKASYVIAAVALLTTALGTIALATGAFQAATGSDWHTMLRGVGIVLILGYLVMAFLVIYSATRVYSALPHMLRRRTEAPGLIFPLIVLSRFRIDDEVDEEMYYEKLSSVAPHDILRDYSNQIVEISNIYQLKQRRINASLRFFGWLTINWIVTMVLLLVIAVLRP